MKKILFLFLIIAPWLLFSPSCKKENKINNGGLSITEMTPGEAFPGETVEVRGTGFATAADQNHVYFNNIEALVNSATATSLSVVVPQGTTTGKVKVEVNDVFIESPTDFVIKQATGEVPVITGFSPLSAPPGATVTISGDHFSSIATENNILINEAVATVSEAGPGSLKVRVPSGATSGKITVTVQGHAAISSGVFVVEDTAAAAPVLTGFSPLEGIAGDPVTIQGSNFSPVPEENLVFINGVQASVTVASATMLKVVVPEQAATGKITLRVNGKEVVSAQGFTVPLMPVITSFFPAEGSEGTEVTILGANFGAAAVSNTVYINNTVTPTSFASKDMLKVMVPVGAATGRISVTTNGMTARTSTTFRVGCFVPQFFGALNDIYGQKGQLFSLAVKCTSPDPANNVITFAGGATAVAQKLEVITWIGEPNWYEIQVIVPPAAQNGVLTLTVNGNKITSDEYFYFN